MKLIPRTRAEVEEASRRSPKTKIQVLLEDFLSGPHDAVELVWEPGEYSGFYSAYKTYDNAVRRYRYAAKVITRSGRLFLVRLDSSETKKTAKEG